MFTSICKKYYKGFEYYSVYLIFKISTRNMNNFLKKLARILPDDILFGESFRHAKKINSAYKESNDKIDFISSYQTEKLEMIYNLAVKTPFYQHLKGTPLQIEKLPFINFLV